MSNQWGCERESILETEVNFSLFIPSQNKDGCARWPYGQKARYCCCLTILKVGENFSGGCWELLVLSFCRKETHSHVWRFPPILVRKLTGNNNALGEVTVFMPISCM